MAYHREIPRDLFNEANLLKCYGQIYINLESAEMPHVELTGDGEAFAIEQDYSSGDTYIANVALLIDGEVCTLRRPLNSREPWPLQFVNDSEEELPLFYKDGTFSQDFIEYAESLAPKKASAAKLGR